MRDAEPSAQHCRFLAISALRWGGEAVAAAGGAVEMTCWLSCSFRVASI